MSAPKIKIMCVSNVYSRLMHFERKGDIEYGHKHDFDHGTLVSSGSILVEIADAVTKQTVTKKEVQAPNFIFIEKNKYHKLTALEDNTVCACIHALKTNDGDLLEPDFLVEPLTGDGKGIIPKTVAAKTGKQWRLPATT
tara:strand:- start:1054 stop:1470 length:417 start_codon:yes stop_codon:yes gene_type:complete